MMASFIILEMPSRHFYLNFFETTKFFTYTSFPFVNTITTESPLEQFEVLKFPTNSYGLYASFFSFFGFNNSLTDFTIIFIFFFLIVFGMFFNKHNFINKTWVQNFMEIAVRSILQFLVSNTSNAQQAHLPFFLLIALTLFTYNFSGLLPFGFTFSAHLICTLFYAFGIFFGLNYIAISRYGKQFFNIFLPSGTPFGLLPLIVLLEIISYFSRPLSLSIRLFANMMSGHALLKILLTFVFQGFFSGVLPFIFSFFGFILIGVILLMEFMVAFLQVFVFITLVSLYLVDVHTVNH